MRLASYVMETAARLNIETSDLVSYTANVWNGGYCQALCNDADAIAGKHYDYAVGCLNEMTNAELVKTINGAIKAGY